MILQYHFMKLESKQQREPTMKGLEVRETLEWLG